MELLLRDPHVLPTDEVIAQALGNSYEAYSEMLKVITGNAYALEPEWRYYNDGKAWLCKVVYKKKTVFWLSIWPGFFKAVFYFTEKNCEDLENLNISEAVKTEFKNSKHIGKLIPLIIYIGENGQIIDLIEVIQYKKSLK